MKTLKEMAFEYLDAIGKVQIIVAEKRSELKQAKERHDRDAVQRISAELAMLYEEIRDMNMIASKLNHYYDDTRLEGIA